MIQLSMSMSVASASLTYTISLLLLLHLLSILTAHTQFTMKTVEDLSIKILEVD